MWLLASVLVHLLLRLWVVRVPGAQLVFDLQCEAQAVHLLEVSAMYRAVEGQQVAAAKPAAYRACC